MKSISHKVINLPLRPISIATLLRRGFHTTSEIDSSKRSGGITNFAAELGCSLSEAASLSREVDQSVLSLTSSSIGLNTNIRSSNETNETNDTLNQIGANKSPNLNRNDYDSEQKRLNVLETEQYKNNYTKNSGISASDLLKNQRKRSTRPIVTFCQAIDTLLGGGFATSEVTEIVGVPGVGKTQLAMQLCVDASIPKPHGGVEGEAVYIDSEGSFSPERCFTMADSLVNHIVSSAMRRKARYQNNNSVGSQSLPPDISESYTSESILSGIHVFRVYDEAAQTATLKSLHEFLIKRKTCGKPVKIVVIDSIAFHYRSISTSTNYVERTRSLVNIAAVLSDIASTFEVSVVVVNHMTTKVEKNSVKSGFNDSREHTNQNHTKQSNVDITIQNGNKLTPALGESWAHSITTRLLLTHDNYYNPSSSSSLLQPRRCTLVKSPHKPVGVALYCVLEVGIRDFAKHDSSTTSSMSQQRPSLSAPRYGNSNSDYDNQIQNTQNASNIVDSSKRPRISF